jgi:hypothetical protein
VLNTLESRMAGKFATLKKTGKGKGTERKAFFIFTYTSAYFLAFLYLCLFSLFAQATAIHVQSGHVP